MTLVTIVDPEAIENLRSLSPGDGDVFLKEILGIYMEDTPVRISELHHSLECGDSESFIRAAHSIKGSSGNVGAAEVRAWAEAIEHQSRKEGIAAQAERLANLESAYKRAVAELQKLLSV